MKAELQKQRAEIDGEESSAGEGSGEDDEWNGVEDGVLSDPLEQDEEFVDEDKYTTVTVEAMDPAGDAFEDDDARVEGEDASSKQVNGHAGSSAVEKNKKKRPRSKDPSNPNAVKKKKKQFRYESKAERQAGRQKQKLKNRAAKARREGK